MVKRLKTDETKRRLRTIATGALFVLIGYLPFINVFPAISIVKELLCVLICLCAVINGNFRFSLETACALVYVLGVGIGVMGNDELSLAAKVNTFRYRCIYAVAFGMFFSSFGFAKEELQKIGNRLLQIIFATGLIVAVVGAVEFFSPDTVYAIYGEELTPHLKVILGESTQTRLISLMRNPINLGFQMSLAIVAGLYFVHKKSVHRSVYKKILQLLSGLLFVIVALYTYSRGAYVVILGSVLAFYLVQVFCGQGHRKKKMMFMGVLCAIAAAFVVLMLVNKELAMRINTISISKLLSNLRFARAREAFQQMEGGFLQLLLGAGAGSRMGDSQQYVFEFGYASLLYESGILGIALFGAVTIKAIKTSIVSIHKGEPTAYLCLAYLCFLVCFGAAMITEDVYFQLPFSLYFWLSIFMIFAIGKSGKHEKTGSETEDQIGDVHMSLKTKIRNMLPDSVLLRWCYFRRVGKILHLKNPKTFNEKLQWLKLHDRKPMYTMIVDKYAVREYITEKLGEKYIVPMLGVWDRFEDIDFDALPDRFVLKCTHDSGGIVIVRDKSQMNMEEAREKITESMARNYYYAGREWPYKNVPPRIIAEEYIEDSCGELADYKVHCFNGAPRMILVCRDRFTETGLTQDFFSEKWEHLPIRRPTAPNSAVEIPRPEHLDEMLRLSARLAKDFPFVRIDFYEVDGKVYFSEITFYPAGGMAKFVPEEWDETLGSWLTLPSQRVR